jgi:hypothetical protein
MMESWNGFHSWGFRMAVVTGSNRRKFQRLDTDFPALLEVSGRRFEGRIQSVSQDGCQIEGSAAARVGEIFNLSFGKPGSPPERFRAKITWARPAAGATLPAFQFGCLFWAVDEDAKRQLLVRLIQFASLHKPQVKAPAESDPATPEALTAAEEAAEAKAAETAGAETAGAETAGADTAATPSAAEAAVAVARPAPDPG